MTTLDENAIRQRLVKELKKFDINGDGKLSAEEEGKFWEHLESKLSPETLEKFKTICANARNGNLTTLDKIVDKALPSISKELNGGSYLAKAALYAASLASGEIITDKAAAGIEHIFPGVLTGPNGTEVKLESAADRTAIFNAFMGAIREAYPNGVAPIPSIKDACAVARK